MLKNTPATGTSRTVPVFEGTAEGTGLTYLVRFDDSEPQAEVLAALHRVAEGARRERQGRKVS